MIDGETNFLLIGAVSMHSTPTSAPHKSQIDGSDACNRDPQIIGSSGYIE